MRGDVSCAQGGWINRDFLKPAVKTAIAREAPLRSQRAVKIRNSNAQRADTIGLIAGDSVRGDPDPIDIQDRIGAVERTRSEEHTSELQSHSFISYAVFCLKK